MVPEDQDGQRVDQKEVEMAGEGSTATTREDGTVARWRRAAGEGGRRAVDEDRAAWREAGWQGGRTGQGDRGLLDRQWPDFCCQDPLPAPPYRGRHAVKIINYYVL